MSSLNPPFESKKPAVSLPGLRTYVDPVSDDTPDSLSPQRNNRAKVSANPRARLRHLQKLQPPAKPAHLRNFPVYKPPARGDSHGHEPLPNYRGFNVLSRLNKCSATIPKLSDSVSQSTETIVKADKRESQATMDEWRDDSSTLPSNRERSSVVNAPESLSFLDAMSSVTLRKRQDSSPAHGIDTSARLSDVTMDRALEVQPRGKLATDTISSTELNEANASSGTACYQGPKPIFFMPGHYDEKDRQVISRKRSTLPKQSSKIMKSWYDQNIANPYPSEEQKAVFSNVTGISMIQVSNWFINRRRSCPVRRERRSLGTTVMPPAPRTVIPIFAEAREHLECLQADIEDLIDGSDDSPESSGSGPGTPVSTGQCSDHTTNNVNEETDAGGGEPNDLRTDTGEATSTSDVSPVHKRSRLDDTNEDRARTEASTGYKKTKLSCLKFICCFHNGPGRTCSGTDETISEVLKKLSEQHDTHVCGHCWVLKIKDESSGLYVHPNNDQACCDHCLSPRCHKTTPTIGHRHLFDPNICRTDTSRVRPGDGEAVYRFVFGLVHPTVDPPSSVLTTEHSLHMDAVPRTCRRKPNREELTARANDLEKRLESGEQQNLANANRIMQLEGELADAHQATKHAEDKNSQLQKQTRRIIAMPSDALRTGMFLDALDHQSLLRRVEEDAPGALVHQSQSLLTPSASDGSRKSTTTPVRNRTDVAGQDVSSQPPAWEGLTHVVPQQTSLSDHTMDGCISDPWDINYGVNDNHGWSGFFDEPRGSKNTLPQI